ncbi:hypothetical protein Tco_0986147, partial [Tanacetum coccineum]
MHSMEKTIAELHAMLKLHEKSIPKKAKTPAVLAKKKPKGAKGKDKGKNKLAYAPKPKPHRRLREDNPQRTLRGRMIAWLVLQGLRGSKKLKHGALSLYMDNEMRAVVEAVRSFDLVLPMSAGTDTTYLLNGYGVLVFRIVIFKISSFKLQN